MQHLKTLPIHGSPEGNTFGLVGSVIRSDDGHEYIKYRYNTTSNDGWVKVTTPSDTTIPTTL